MKSNIFKLLDNLGENTSFNVNDRVVLIDGFNLFMRNFAVINYMNDEGAHIGGLGGFLRSLGTLVKEFNPTSIYIIFDGIGSSVNRKNLVPDYKIGRTRQKLTNKNIFNNLQEESEAKVSQISRLVHYLKCLPVKVISIDRIEADDIIAYLALKIANDQSKVFIVSSDNDFFQLISDNITVYRPQEKVYYNREVFKNKFSIFPENYLVYKTLVGDSADNIKGIKDLGPKTLLQKFPEILESDLSLNDIFKISEEKYQKHIIYSRILFDRKLLEDTYKIMDLKNPMLDEEEKEFINKIVNEPVKKLDISSFVELFSQDRIGNNIIKNISFWLNENFTQLNSFSVNDPN